MTAPAPPRTLGKYELLSRLAVGGMAELFLARDAKAGRLVVIKRIHPHLCQEERLAGMFLDEARIAAQLDHPNVVQVLELGRADDSLFIAMEYVEGVDVSQLCEEVQKDGHTLSFAIGGYIIAQVCAGLDHAHSRKGRDGLPLNIVHRDVNPKNVMVGFDGSVKLVDFGIAKARTMIEQTRPGTIKGKYQYFSPEQVDEAPVDQRADIFALGITLYEITTGKSPFLRPSIDAMLNAICSEPVLPPGQALPGYPPALEAIVTKCLMKDPRERYHRAAEVQADLEEFLHLSDPRAAARGLSQYLATLFRRGDDATLPFVPWSTSKASLAEILAIPPLRSVAPEKPSAELLQAANAFAGGLAGGTGPPSLEELPATVQTGGAADRDRTVRANSRVRRASPGPPQVPTPKRGPSPSWIKVGALSFAALAVLASVLVVWQRLARRQAADPPALIAELEVPPEPIVTAPIPVAPPPPPVPAPAPVTFTLVAVKFNGPAGMPITRDRKFNLKAGAIQKLKPKTYRLVYRCPGKTRGKPRYRALNVTVPNTAETMEVTLSCK